MRINGLFDLGGVARVLANMGHASGDDGLRHAGAGKKLGLELVALPVAPQQWEEDGGEPYMRDTSPVYPGASSTAPHRR
jgi:hypothetical protein